MHAPNRRRCLQLATGCVALGLVSRTAWADPHLRVTVELEFDRVRVGEAVTYTVKVVSEGTTPAPEPTLPAVLADAFAVEGPQVSTGWQNTWINGQVNARSTQTLVYLLIPRKPGRYALGVQVDAGGSKVASNVPTLEVTGQAVDEQDAGERERPTRARGDVFLWGTVDKQTAYVGEQVTYTLDVFERSRFVNIHLRTLPKFQDFWTVELPEGRQRTELVEGIPYRVHPALVRAVFPQRAGRLEIEPAEVMVGFRRVIHGSPLSLEVLPLPSEGRPRLFSPNNVGQFAISAEVDRDRVKQGEPFTLTVMISGRGNIKLVDPGAWPSIDGVRRYDPKEETTLETASTIGGHKRYSFLMIPERAGTLTVPAHAFAFFDPQARRYVSVETKPIEVTVEAHAMGVESTGEATARETVEDVAALAPIVDGETLPRRHVRTPWLTPRRFAYGLLSAPATLGAVALGRVLWRRVGGDAAALARARLRAQRRARLAHARSCLSSGEGFHAAVAQSLHELAVERAGNEGIGLPRPELLELLARQGVSPEDLQRFGKLLDRCDAARFAAQHGTEAERAVLLDEAVDLIERSSLAREGAR